MQKVNINDLQIRTCVSEQDLQTCDSAVCVLECDDDGNEVLRFASVVAIIIQVSCSDTISNMLFFNVNFFDDIEDDHILLVEDLREGCDFRSVRLVHPHARRDRNNRDVWILQQDILRNRCLLLPTQTAANLFSIVILP